MKRSSYSYYIIHFVIMVVVGHFLTEWNLNLLTEFLALSVMTFAGTALTYEFLLGERNFGWEKEGKVIVL